MKDKKKTKSEPTDYKKLFDKWVHEGLVNALRPYVGKIAIKCGKGHLLNKKLKQVLTIKQESYEGGVGLTYVVDQEHLEHLTCQDCVEKKKA